MNRQWRPKQFLTVSLVSMALLVLAVPGAQASESSDLDKTYAQIAKVSPGVDVKELKSQVRAQAKIVNTSELAVAKATLEDLKTVSTSQPASAGMQVSAAAIAASVKPAKLPTAVHGDIFWWDSATDHVGIYISNKQVAHAPGPTRRLAVEYATDVKPKGRVEVMLVNTKKNGKTRMGTKERNAAATFAESKKGKFYNPYFHKNKIIHDLLYNCSQLVWAAWKINGIDLDNGISLGVYPGDIRDDPRTHVYKIVKK